jgi:hypothetical protein
MKIKNETEERESEQYVPYVPSSSIVSFLFALSEQIEKIGGHTIDKVCFLSCYFVIFLLLSLSLSLSLPLHIKHTFSLLSSLPLSFSRKCKHTHINFSNQSVIQYMKREVSDTLYTIFVSTLDEHQNVLYKENAIQLWFDFRILFDLLSGRAITNPLMKELLEEMKAQHIMSSSSSSSSQKNQTISNQTVSTDHKPNQENIKHSENHEKLLDPNFSNQNEKINKERAEINLDNEDEEVIEMIEWKKKSDLLFNKIKEKVKSKGIDINLFFLILK